MNVLHRSTLAVAIAAMFVAAPHAAFAQGKVTLRFGDSLPATHFFTETVAKPWMAEVTKATNGQVEFQHYPAEQLGKAKDMLQLMESGVVDVGLVVPPYIDKLPLSGVAELPGGFATSCAGVKALWKNLNGGTLEKAELQPNGLRVFAIIVQPPFQVYTTKKKIESVKDLEGQKLRTTGGAMDLMVRKLGGVPVRLSAPEVNESMSRGTIDGGVLAVVSVGAYKLTPMLKYGTQGENFGSAALYYGMHDSTLKKLSPAVQKAIFDAGRKVTFEACAKIDESAGSDEAKMRASGITLTQIVVADRPQVNAAFDAVGVDWAEGLDKRGKPGSAVRKEFLDALKEK
jgi:TRAP-type C4-dicarboxylate transport system substrate-binding protein